MLANEISFGACVSHQIERWKRGKVKKSEFNPVWRCDYRDKIKCMLALMNDGRRNVYSTVKKKHNNSEHRIGKSASTHSFLMQQLNVAFIMNAYCHVDCGKTRFDAAYI